MQELKLWQAVLAQAAHDYQLPLTKLIAGQKRGQKTRKLVAIPEHNDAQRWFRSQSTEPGSCQWICGLLNLEPSWLTNRLDSAQNAVNQMIDVAAMNSSRPNV